LDLNYPDPVNLVEIIVLTVVFLLNNIKAADRGIYAAAADRGIYAAVAAAAAIHTE
jgi:hypothetical protein